MQFAGQRTDLELKPVGESFNLLIKLTEDILPDPDAVLLTGITPQATLQDGLTEVEFLRLFHEQIATPGTIFVGYNTVRFDDEFMRFLHYRNFYDAYEWEWQDGKSRWDILDVVRMTRALRPDGIKWPVDENGKPTNRLELLTKLNGLDHEHAHDALNDVWASIAVAQLIRSKQPSLFNYLLGLRSKKDVKEFVNQHKVFLYSSGKYDSETEKTAVVQVVHAGDDREGAIVYDLRYDPSEFADLSPEALADRMSYTKDPTAPSRVPVKTLKYNHCPAITLPGLLRDQGVQQRLHVTPELMQANATKLHALPSFQENVVKARDLLDEERGEQWSKEEPDVDTALYGGSFWGENDKQLMGAVRAAAPSELADIAAGFHDGRLQSLLPRYKARNFAPQLTDEERAAWERYRYQRLMAGGADSRLAKYMHRLGELAKIETGQEKRYLLEELQLYAESIMPVIDTEQ